MLIEILRILFFVILVLCILGGLLIGYLWWKATRTNEHAHRRAYEELEKVVPILMGLPDSDKAYIVEHLRHMDIKRYHSGDEMIKAIFMNKPDSKNLREIARQQRAQQRLQRLQATENARYNTTPLHRKESQAGEVLEG